MSGQPRLAEIHAVASQRDSFAVQELALPLPHREASVRADDPVPGQILVGGGKHVADQSRRAGVDVAVGADEPLGNLPHAGDDPLDARPIGNHPAATI